MNDISQKELKMTSLECRREFRVTEKWNYLQKNDGRASATMRIIVDVKQKRVTLTDGKRRINIITDFQ